MPYVAFSLPLLIGSWSTLYLLHTFLLSYPQTSGHYAKFLHKSGLSMNILQIKWYTVKLNRYFIRLSNWKANFWRSWFNIGVFIGIFGQLLSILLLIYTLFGFFKNKPTDEPVLVPVIPGVNLPSNQNVYYFLTLFLCGFVHELGHAIAASREQVRVNSFGFFLLFIFPGAFVDLHTDHLEIASSIKQLRIFCAGVWHNFVLAFISLSILYIHPYIVITLFTKTASVSFIDPGSSLKTMLPLNSNLKTIDSCNVNSSYTWYSCLNELLKNPHNGYCMNVDEIYLMASSYVQKDTHVKECCFNNTATNYCFKWEDENSTKKTYACLPARYTTDQKSCKTSSDCDNLSMACIMPVYDNFTQLIRIAHDRGPAVLYVGSVKELAYSLRIDDFIPKFSFIPNFLNLQFQLFLKYLIAFNSAIAILNLVPCYALDGQHILSAVLLTRNTKTYINSEDNERYPKTYLVMMTIGTALLILNLVLALYSLFVK